MLRAPIFIVGLNKSGTSLLYLMLSRHPSLSGLKPSEDQGPKSGSAMVYLRNHGLTEGHKVAGLPDKLRVHSRSYMFAHPHVLPEYRLTEKEVEPGDQTGVEEAYRQAMADPGKRLIEKSPPNLVRTRYLQALFPDAVFIHIVRDPYANVAANAKKRERWGSVEEQAAHWASGNAVYLNDSGGLGRARTVRYEDLIAVPEATLRRICDVCWLDWSPAAILPVEQDVNGRLTAMLTREETDIISRAVPPELFKAFGYRRSWRSLLARALS